jgi:hypothetical protein
MVSWRATSKGFPQNLSGCGMTPEGLPEWSGSAPDFGPAFFSLPQAGFSLLFQVN